MFFEYSITIEIYSNVHHEYLKMNLNKPFANHLALSFCFFVHKGVPVLKGRSLQSWKPVRCS